MNCLLGRGGWSSLALGQPGWFSCAIFRHRHWCKPFAFWHLRGRAVASFATLGPTFEFCPPTFCFFWLAVNIEEARQWAVGFAGGEGLGFGIEFAKHCSCLRLRLGAGRLAPANSACATDPYCYLSVDHKQLTNRNDIAERLVTLPSKGKEGR